MANNGPALFKAFFDAIEEPALLIDRDLRVVGANSSFLGARGIKKPQALGRPCYEVEGNEKKPCSPCPVRDAFKTGKRTSIVRSRQNGKGLRHFELKAIPLVGDVAVEIAREITGQVSLRASLDEKTATVELLDRITKQWSESDSPGAVLENISGYITEQLGYKMAWVGLIDKNSKEVRPVFSAGSEADYLSSAAFPLVSKGKTIGVLNVYSGSPDAFSGPETEILRTLSFYAAVAIESSIFLDTIKRGKKEWEDTFDAIASPIFIHDLHYRVLKANRAYQEASGLPFREIIGKPYYEVFPKGAGPLPSCKKAAETGEQGKKTEEIHTPSGEVLLSDAFPMLEGERPAAYVHVLKDITKLIKAQQRIREEARISHSLLGFTTNIGRLLDITAIFGEASRTLLKLISCERTAILLRHDEEEDYRPVVFHGWQDHYVPLMSTLRLRPGELPMMDMLLKGEDVALEDAAGSELVGESFAETFGLRAVIASPFITGEGVLGAILAERKDKFTEKEKHILKGITSNTAIAVENARLYKESIEMAADLARRMETIRTTFEIDRTILSTLNRKEILEVATKNTQRIIPADKVITVNIEEKEGGYSYKSGIITFGSSPLLDSVIRTGRVVSVPDLALHRHAEPVITDLIREGLGSLIALPLYTKGRRFGCILMASRRIAAFDKDDISNGEKLTAQLAIALENAKLYEDIKELFISIIRALVNAVDAKSPWTKGHSERVTEYAMAIGREMEVREDELERLRLASLLHDIGKIGTYDTVLDKPDRLTDEEFRLVKMHPGRGAEIIRPIRQLEDIGPIVRGHHEKMDGSGYPDGLKGEEIPLLARVLCVADSYDSMTADRPYRPAPGKDYAVSELKRCSGTQFDPRVVEAFLKVIS